MQNKAQQQKVNKADKNCEMKHQPLWSVTFIFRNWKNTKINFRVAPQQIIKK